VDAAGYLEERHRWCAAAPTAAAALAHGRTEPALSLLVGWRFGAEGGRRVLERLVASPPQVDGRAWAVAFGESTANEPLASEWRHTSWTRAESSAPAGDLLAWALHELAAQAWLIDQQDRRPWCATVPPGPEDAAVAAMWRGWAEGNPWPHRAAWERAFLKPALAAFSAVLRARSLPEDLRRRALSDAREGFFYALVGVGAEAGWREVAVRLIEAGGGDPVDALARALPGPSWERVARCAVTRGHGRSTAGLVWGETGGWQVHARRLRAEGGERPERLGELLDLHLALRLLDHWSQVERTAPERSAAVVAHNRGRARSRLRASLREAPAEHLLERVLALPGLAARTRGAVARFSRDWAWQQVQHGFSFYDARTIDPACLLPEGGPPPLPAEALPALRTWVLRVLLKGRLAHLRQWVHGGPAEGGDPVDPKDATWGRLLKDDCPELLRSYPGASRTEGLARLRAELVEQLPELWPELIPVLGRLAALSERGPALERAFLRELPDWDERVPFPKVRYRDYQAAATQALRGLGVENGPPNPCGGDSGPNPR